MMESVGNRIIQFLAGYTVILGIEFQNWLPITVGSIAIYFIYSWVAHWK